METVTRQLMCAGAKEAANYSPTCKYSWKMIVLIWTSAILIKYLITSEIDFRRKGERLSRELTFSLLRVRLSTPETAAEG